MKPYYQDKWVQIYHGDCREILPQLPDNSVDLAATSPPYNVGMKYEQIMDWEEYYEFTKLWLNCIKGVLKDGGVLAINLPKEVRHTKEQLAKYGRRVEKVGERVDLMCEELGFLPREAIVWGKGSEGQPISSNFKMGSDNNIYIRSVCELILLHSKERYFYDGGTGMRGKVVVPFLDETKDIWWISPVRDDKHPCPWPPEIPTRLIKMFTLDRKFVPLILDPFLGSGTTCYCAKKLNRSSIGIEIEEKYCEIAAKRCSPEVMAIRKEIKS